MNKTTLTGYFVNIMLAAAISSGCSNKKRDIDLETKHAVDSIQQHIGDVYNTEYIKSKDSTEIYGTGNFDYHDSLESFHRGYSIPRDSIYKVWNTKAFKQLDEYIKTHPLEPKPYLDRANHWQNIKLYPEAIADYNKYIELWAYNPSAWMNRGNAHERLKHYDSAMFDYNRTLELKPNDTIANFNKGNIYDILAKYDSAVMQYDTVIMKDPRLAKAYYNRGASNTALKRYENAIVDWEVAIKLNPLYEPDLRPRIEKLKRLL
jgi:tetratricopeptide (TPR) repeat protein